MPGDKPNLNVILLPAQALGDLCVSPHVFVEHSSPSSLQQDILEYYTSCEPARTNPFSVVVRKGTQAVDAVFYSLSAVARLAKQLYSPAQVCTPRAPVLELLYIEKVFVWEVLEFYNVVPWAVANLGFQFRDWQSNPWLS